MQAASTAALALFGEDIFSNYSYFSNLRTIVKGLCSGLRHFVPEQIVAVGFSCIAEIRNMCLAKVTDAHARTDGK